MIERIRERHASACRYIIFLRSARCDLSATANCDGQECPSYGIALYRWADATPLAAHHCLWFRKDSAPYKKHAT